MKLHILISLAAATSLAYAAPADNKPPPAIPPRDLDTSRNGQATCSPLSDMITADCTAAKDSPQCQALLQLRGCLNTITRLARGRQPPSEEEVDDAFGTCVRQYEGTQDIDPEVKAPAINLVLAQGPTADYSGPGCQGQ
ncbi:hypothetical protein BDV26DRAFT_297405 [Aspergillus bertholletiae]|uniref:Uncharacterized protein n=1 Tax=Aspergillus bertholletiae TaxID=1226010 RepID=A0A5N7ASS4_9EURO|nr:hypothetical protein BDV26DRAFT_297405 [Aspergillus bertholletiae]